MRILVALVVLAGAALAGAPGPASAQPVDVPETWGGSFMDRPRLTGSWGGLRDALGKKGVVFDVDLLTMPQGVLDGGRETDGEVWGNVDYALHVDTGKAGLWPGGFLYLYGSTSFGESIFAESGTLPADTLPLFPEPNEPNTGLMNATFMQFLSPKFGLVGGKIFTFDADHGEFSGNYRTQFSNSSLVIPLSMALVPISAWGGGLVVLPFEGVTLSALALDPSGSVERNDPGDAFDDGVMMLASAVVDVHPFGLRGHQKAGFVWSNKDRLALDQDPGNLSRLLLNERFPRLGDPGPILEAILERFFPALPPAAEPPKQRANTWSMFYGFDQYLWQPEGEPGRGIGVFFTFGMSDEDTSPVEYAYLVGIGGNGVVPRRPDDTFGVGWARSEFSDDLVPFLRDALDLGLDHEDVVEVFYNVAITSWLNATLDLQVVEPGLEKKLASSGGLDDVDTAVIGGLRLRVRF
jgi:porin